MGQGYSQVGTFWGVLNLSLRAYGVQLGNFEWQIGGEDKTLQTDKQTDAPYWKFVVMMNRYKQTNRQKQTFG